MQPADQTGDRSWLRDIPVKGRRQAPDEPPKFLRQRFSWNIRELSGAFGDLGTFLPHIIGAITIVGMAPAGILISFGLFYISTGALYALPIAIQPMKAVSAVILVETIEPGAVAGAGIIIGLFFLVVGVTGFIDRLAKLIPGAVASGLQLGLGLSLAVLGVRMVGAQPWLGIGICVLILILLRNRHVPAVIVALVVGVVVGQLTGLAPPIGNLVFGFHLPSLVVPSWEQLLNGARNAALPQIPLTLTNAIIVTAAVTRQLFPLEVHVVNERNLSLTTGIGNLLAAPFGGYPMCHGAGGITGHYRFGARSGAAPLVIGTIFLLLGLIFGNSVTGLLQSVPEAVLGALLLFSGVDLAQSSEPRQYQDSELLLVLLISAICLAFNPAIAFALGLPLAHLLKRNWVKL